MTPGRVAVAAALALAGCALAACSSAPPGTTPDTAPHPSTAATAPRAQAVANDPRACAVAPSATVGSALHLPVGKVIGTVEGPVTVCAYQGRYEVIVRFQRNETAGQFAADKRATGTHHQAITSVAGLGDSAYLATYTLAKPPANTLAVLHSGEAVYITSPAAPAAERKLMQQLLSRT